MYIPPFTASTWPVMYAASSLTRNFTALATSAGAHAFLATILNLR